MLNRAAQPALVEHTEQRGGLSEIAIVRGAIFLALVGGAGFSAWTSFQDSSRNPLDWAVGEVHAMVTQPDDETAEEERSDIVDAHPVVLQTETGISDDRFTISKDTLAAITCGPWDISDVGIEVILQEMIRRGWTPPSGAKALEASHHNGAVAQAIDPDARVPAVGPPSTPAVSAETQSSTDVIRPTASTL
jgi:hypothetical protein